MVNLMKSKELYNNIVKSHNPTLDQYLLVQNEQIFP